MTSILANTCKDDARTAYLGSLTGLQLPGREPNGLVLESRDV
ncbi:hypothetical protein JI435_402730 [Parastagonospora nodorum SN15]|uniref:Uncharacterized protein n=1 Tax=Phaeosphaeria nodorum (strain SN15 / ATCC MYA-4574 / FGSC 10173) TaxID=321614 RepID=A0A7U2HUQ3_PHANO|nr:hypothetical protein JI435_402730 [Parastagonospora nodorum SN15]